MKSIFRKLIFLTKPVVWQLAEAYDLKVQRPGHAYGRHALEIEDRENAIRHNICKSVYFNTSCGAIRLGRRVLISENVMFLTGKHMNIAEAENIQGELHAVPESGRDIVVEEGVYIGSGAILVGPVKVGAHATVAAGAVVTKDVEARTMVAGVPARVMQRY